MNAPLRSESPVSNEASSHEASSLALGRPLVGGEQLESPTPPQRMPRHVVLLTNFIPPYRLPVYQELANRVERLTVLLSTPMESNRSWAVDWGDLNVEVQRSWTLHRRWRHQAGFEDALQVHFPVDTLPRLRQLRPDVVISAELGARSLQSALYCRWARKARLILWATLSESTEHGRGAARQLLRRWLLRRAERVIVNGSSGARYVQRFGVQASQLDRVPYTAATRDFDNVPLSRRPDQAHDLVFAGQLVERKGLLPFLRVLRAWAMDNPQRRLRFLIAGTGPLHGPIRDFQVPTNVRVEMLGQQPSKALSETYARGGIFIFPTLADEWGLVVNEALSAGLPVLGSLAAQSVEELCETGRNGWCFSPSDPQQMSDALAEAMATPIDRLQRMRVAARERTRQLTPAWAASRIEESLREVLKSRQRTKRGED